MQFDLKKNTHKHVALKINSFTLHNCNKLFYQASSKMTSMFLEHQISILE